MSLALTVHILLDCNFYENARKLFQNVSPECILEFLTYQVEMFYIIVTILWIVILTLWLPYKHP